MYTLRNKYYINIFKFILYYKTSYVFFRQITLFNAYLFLYFSIFFIHFNVLNTNLLFFS